MSTEDEHTLSAPRPSTKPDAGGFWVVDCSCGYSTAPNGYPGRAESAARDHQRAKQAQR